MSLDRTEQEKKQLDQDPQVDLEKYIEEKVKPIAESANLEIKQEKPRVPLRAMHNERLMCYMAAFGCSNAEIAEHFKMTEKDAVRILSKKFNKEETRRIQEKVFLEKADKVFQRILPKAIFTAEEIMDNKGNNPNVRLNAAIQFMDRSLGKPTQHIEQEGSLLRDLFTKMDEMQKAKEIKPDIENAEFKDVSEKTSEAEKLSEEPKDEIDSFAEDHFS